MQNSALGAFCNTFDLHLVKIGLENQFSVFLRVANFTQVLLYILTLTILHFERFKDLISN